MPGHVSTPHPSPPPRPTPPLRPLALAALVYSLTACTPSDPTWLTTRTTEARLSTNQLWSPCAPPDSLPLPRTRCPQTTDNLPPNTAQQAIKLATRLANDTTLPARSSRALLDLRERGDNPTTLRRVTSRLRDLAQRDSSPALLNDLAVALLEEASVNQALPPLLEALEAIERASKRATRPAFLFNRALILERMGLYASAHEAWNTYVATNDQEQWNAEGLRHQERVTSIVTSSERGAGMLAALDGWSALESRAVDHMDTARARELAFGLLGIWTTLRETDVQSASAARSLLQSLAARLGDAERATLKHSTESIEEGKGSALNAYRDYSAGYRNYLTGSYEQAAAQLGRAASALRTQRSPLWCWATLFHGASLVNLGAPRSSMTLPQRLATPECSDRATKGKASWIAGLARVREGDYEGAAADYRRALVQYEGLGEQESEGMLRSLLAESLLYSGYRNEAETEALRAMALLAPIRGSRFLPVHLNLMTRLARERSYPLAAMRLTDEVMRLNALPSDPARRAWSLTLRARDLMLAGLRDSSASALRQALSTVDGMPPGLGKEQMRAEILLEATRTPAMVTNDSIPALMPRILETLSKGNNRIQLPEAALEAARVRLAARDTIAGEQWLNQSIALLEQRRLGFTRPEDKARFGETAEQAFDLLMRLQLQRGTRDQAFDVLERARRVSKQRASTQTEAGYLERIRRATSADEVVLAYVVLDESTEAWVVTSDSIAHFSADVRRDEIAAMAASFHEDRFASPAEERRVLGRLYQQLVAPAEWALAGRRRLTVIPDRELILVPFPALWDASQSRFLIQRLAVSQAPTAGDLLASVARTRRRAPQRAAALLVGDPALDRTAFPSLPRLPAARNEIAAIGPLYKRTTTFVDSAATRSAVLSSWRNASVVHFAGHAIANVDRPEASVLVLAGGVLRAEEIATLRLSTVQVAVLSACRTYGGRASHTGMNHGLSASFLHAGVGATVSSLWDVADRDAEEIVTAFHARYAAGEGAAEALREALVVRAAKAANDTSSVRSWAAWALIGQ